MNDNKRAAHTVLVGGCLPAAPDPFEADYGPLTDEMFAYIDKRCPQDQFGGADFVVLSEFK